VQRLQARDSFSDSDGAVMAGKGVALDISNQYWNFHVNYADGQGRRTDRNGKPVKDEMSGRSYGMGPDGNATDPSDANYLRELAKMLQTSDETEITTFYSTLIQLI